MDDFAQWQRCFTEGSTGGTLNADCFCFDRDGDQEITYLDFNAFKSCASGSDVLAGPGCE